VHFDFIIIGQGICGTLLSYELLQRGKSVLVVDDGRECVASKVAGAVLNPVNGKALWQSRRQEALLPVAINKYRELEKIWHLPLITEMPLLHFHTEEKLRVYFEERAGEIPDLLSVPSGEAAKKWQALFHYDFGTGLVQHCQVVQARALLAHARSLLQETHCLLAEKWNWEALQLLENGLAYKDHTARMLICCEGPAVRENPFFRSLPFTKNKGDALLLNIPGLPRHAMYQHGLRLVPWEGNLFWAGSNQIWDYEAAAPDATWAAEATAQLRHWLKLPFQVVKQLFAERPTTAGQQVFLGCHPHFRQVALLNGLGTRGFSASPFYTQQLAAMLCGEAPLTAVKHKSLTAG